MAHSSPIENYQDEALSPPPTPPPDPPAPGKTRFKRMGTPCEWIEAYHPGGYLPVHFGDRFKDGRYKVIRKLGAGSFSTVWLAHDLASNRYVALKILVAKISEEPNELKIFRYLAQAAGPRISEHIAELLDEFKHTGGPNGTHHCLVFELMGPSVNNMVEDLPCFKPRRPDMRVRYPVWMAKRILRQVLLALAFLDRNGIAHGDLQPGNMLFTLQGLEHIDESKISQDKNYKWGSISSPVKRKDGKIDKWAPTYLAVPQPLDGFADIGPQFRIKLSDLGGAWFINQPPKRVVTPLGLRAPELIVSDNVNRTLDIWAFGCLVFELVIGQPLFYMGWHNTPESTADDHLLMLSDTLGPLPESIHSLWTRSSKYYTPERVQYNTFISEPPDDETDLLSAKGQSLEDLFDENKPDDLSSEEANVVKALIRRILQYDPAKRPTPSQILQDPWFTR